jgi:hypothetical protein
VTTKARRLTHVGTWVPSTVTLQSKIKRSARAMAISARMTTVIVVKGLFMAFASPKKALG